MGKTSKLTLYKYCRTDAGWRYCKAVVSSNGKIKPDFVVVGSQEQKHPEGSYYLANKGQWIPVGNNALEAQRKRMLTLHQLEYERLSGKTPVAATLAGRTPLALAAGKYFSNCEARGLDPKSIRAYRSAVDPFVSQCKRAYVEDVGKQDLIDFIGWLRKQPVPKRKHGNPDRTINNKVGHLTIFLKEFGVSHVLKKNEYPRYHKKKVVAHTDEELALLYGHANAEELFLLDYFIGSMARDHEAYGCCYTDLTGTTLTLYGKQHKTRTVEISPRLADAIIERGKRSNSEYLFPNSKGRPNQHLLRDLQGLAKKAGAKFHCELHKLRKTGASRRYLAGVPLMTLMQELGHESLETTQDYLADVKKDETKKAVADADFVSKPKVVKTKTGTQGD
jgi:integrase